MPTVGRNSRGGLQLYRQPTMVPRTRVVTVERIVKATVLQGGGITYPDTTPCGMTQYFVIDCSSPFWLVDDACTTDVKCLDPANVVAKPENGQRWAWNFQPKYNTTTSPPHHPVRPALGPPADGGSMPKVGDMDSFPGLFDSQAAGGSGASVNAVGSTYRKYCVMGTRVEARFRPFTDQPTLGEWVADPSSGAVPGTRKNYLWNHPFDYVARRGDGVLFSQVVTSKNGLKLIEPTGEEPSRPLQRDYTIERVLQQPFTQSSVFRANSAFGGPNQEARIVQTVTPKTMNAVKDIDDKSEFWGTIDDLGQVHQNQQHDYLVVGVCPRIDPLQQQMNRTEDPAYSTPRPDPYAPNPTGGTAAAEDPYPNTSGTAASANPFHKYIIPDGEITVRITQKIKFAEPLATQSRLNRLAIGGNGPAAGGSSSGWSLPGFGQYVAEPGTAMRRTQAALGGVAAGTLVGSFL